MSSIRLVNFPDGDWRVLFGGHVRLGSAPNPEHVYFVPIEGLGNHLGQVRFVQVGLGDLPLLTPCSEFKDGVRYENDLHQIHDFTVNFSRPPDEHERPLSRLLSIFQANEERCEYVEGLRNAVKQHSHLDQAPVIGVKEVYRDRFLVAPAAEWYRMMYGRKSYLAHLFLRGSSHEILENLVVTESTGMVSAEAVNLTRGVGDIEELLGIVPRAQVNDEFAPLVSNLYLNEEARRNAEYAGKSLRGDSISDPEGPFWLKFGHPYPQQVMTVRARGISGRLDTKTGVHEVFLCTSLVGHSPPKVPPHFIIRRENDGRSASEHSEGETISTSAPDIDSGCWPTALVEASDNPNDVKLDSPHMNPEAGAPPSQHIGAAFDSMGAPPPIKHKRRGKLGEPTVRPINGRDLEQPDQVTTNAKQTVLGQAGAAVIQSRSELQGDGSLLWLIRTLVFMEEKREISDLRSINYRPSEYSLGSITLQLPNLSWDNRSVARWLKVQGRKCPRLTLSVSFTYEENMYIALDVERRNESERFCFLIAKYHNTFETRPKVLRNITSACVDAIHEAKGVLKNAKFEIAKIEHKILQHHVEDIDGDRRIREAYVAHELRALASVAPV